MVGGFAVAVGLGRHGVDRHRPGGGFVDVAAGEHGVADEQWWGGVDEHHPAAGHEGPQPHPGGRGVLSGENAAEHGVERIDDVVGDPRAGDHPSAVSQLRYRAGAATDRRARSVVRADLAGSAGVGLAGGVRVDAQVEGGFDVWVGVVDPVGEPVRRAAERVIGVDADGHEDVHRFAG